MKVIKVIIMICKVLLLLDGAGIVLGISLIAVNGVTELSNALVLYGLVILLIATFLFLCMMILFPYSKKYFI